MTRTLRRERIQKFETIIKAWIDNNPVMVWRDGNYDVPDEQVTKLANALADAAASRTEAQTEETPEEYNVEVFRGDFREFPEHLWEIAKVLRDVWMFRLPPKPKTKSEKGQYAMWCLMMDNVKQACGEFGADVLVKVHADWRVGFKGAIAPYTVAQPSSLVNPCSGKAREMREGAVVANTNTVPVYTPPADEPEYVPAPQRKP